MLREEYSDVDWISHSDEIKATNGFVFMLCHGPVALTQTIVTKLVALDVASRDAKQFKELLSAILFFEILILVVLIHCDNQTVIAQVHSKNHKYLIFVTHRNKIQDIKRVEYKQNDHFELREDRGKPNVDQFIKEEK